MPTIPIVSQDPASATIFFWTSKIIPRMVALLCLTNIWWPLPNPKDALRSPGMDSDEKYKGYRRYERDEKKTGDC